MAKRVKSKKAEKDDIIVRGRNITFTGKYADMVNSMATHRGLSAQEWAEKEFFPFLMENLEDIAALTKKHS